LASTLAHVVSRGNRLLSALPPEERCRLDGHGRQVHLPKGEVLLAPNEVVRYAYFPTDGVIALLMVLEDRTPVEVANIGNEGFASVESILSTDRSPYEVSCQTGVEALRLDVADLRTVFRESDAVRNLLLRYAAVVFACTSRSLACKVEHTTEQRLARWLLMSRDRIAGDDLPFTQETLARMLGVNRPTVSITAESLKERGAIDYHRGRLTVTNRAILEAASCEHYRAYRASYEELLGPIPPPT
jgi:CRP-like cAMP-binding protein